MKNFLLILTLAINGAANSQAKFVMQVFWARMERGDYGGYHDRDTYSLSVYSDSTVSFKIITEHFSVLDSYVSTNYFNGKATISNGVLSIQYAPLPLKEFKKKKFGLQLIFMGQYFPSPNPPSRFIIKGPLIQDATNSFPVMAKMPGNATSWINRKPFCSFIPSF